MYIPSGWKFVNFRNFIFFFPKAKLASKTLATIDNFNVKKEKKEKKLEFSFIRSISIAFMNSLQK